MRDAIYAVSSTLVGTTGPLTMLAGEGNADGAEADGRDVDTVTFCAVNLRPHASQGGRFEVISTLNGGELGSASETGGFQVRKWNRNGRAVRGEGRGVLFCYLS